MHLSKLVKQTRIPQEYLVFLKGVLDGMETDDSITEEDLELVEELEEQLISLELDEED